MKQLEKECYMKLYNYEAKKYILNKECKDRLVMVQYQLTNTNTLVQQQEDADHTSTNSLSFADILPILSKEHFSKDAHKINAKSSPTRPQLCAFAHIHQTIPKFKGRYPQYKKCLVVEMHW